MKIESRAGMLKIYVGESDKVHGRWMFEEIVFEARKSDCSRKCCICFSKFDCAFMFAIKKERKQREKSELSF
jgi:hypothetical protein